MFVKIILNDSWKEVSHVLVIWTTLIEFVFACSHENNLFSCYNFAALHLIQSHSIQTASSYLYNINLWWLCRFNSRFLDSAWKRCRKHWWVYRRVSLVHFKSTCRESTGSCWRATPLMKAIQFDYSWNEIWKTILCTQPLYLPIISCFSIMTEDTFPHVVCLIIQNSCSYMKSHSCDIHCYYRHALFQWTVYCW